MLDREELRRGLREGVKPVKLLLKYLEVTLRMSPGLWYSERGLKLSVITQRQTSNGVGARVGPTQIP